MFKRSVAPTSAVAGISVFCWLQPRHPPAGGRNRAAWPSGVVLPGLLHQIEKSSGHKVTVGYATLGAITKRFMDGEAVDVTMVLPEQNEDLQKRGKLLAGSRAEIAKVGFAVFVKKGAPNPDLASVDALETHAAGGKVDRSWRPSCRWRSRRLHCRLDRAPGLAADLKARIRLVNSGTAVAEAVAKVRPKSELGSRATRQLFQALTLSRCQQERRAIPCMWRGLVRAAGGRAGEGADHVPDLSCIETSSEG